jgi:preprotein translocase subunit SecG
MESIVIATIIIILSAIVGVFLLKGRSKKNGNKSGSGRGNSKDYNTPDKISKRD